ncbi:MAG: hypothetical protein F9K29_00120 [Hyphomicrobiaceae bacterium]|nr:MAG: hypothetical protein F9K29_00120 [Hyphomicrobiaceae bacterium]
MTIADNAFRLAIGIFYEAAKLESVMAELRADGFTLQDVCLVGTAAALNAAREHATGTQAADGMAALDSASMQTLDCRLEGMDIVATQGPLIQSLVETRRFGHPSRRSWLQQELCDRLAGHVRKGAIAVLVSVRSAVSQQRCSRILLRHSSHAVQTHEFTLSPFEPA